MTLNNLIAQSLYKNNVSWLRRLLKDNILESVEKEAVEAITKHFTRYAEVPSFSWLNSNFPYFWIATPAETNEKLSSIYDDFLKKSIDRKIGLQASALSTIYENAGTIDSAVLKSLQSLKYENFGVNEYEDLANFEMTSYERAAGLDYSVGSLNEMTAGLKNGEVLVIAGRPKSAKTTFALWLAYQWYLYENKNIFIVSKEMKPVDLFAKINSYIAGVNPLFFRRLNNMSEAEKWTNPDYIRLKVASEIVKNNTLGSIKSAKNNIQTGEDLRDTLNNLDKKPDVVIVDGMYLMGTNKSAWERVSEVSRDLKLVAGECNVPIIGITQINRSGKGKEISQETIAYSDSIAQNSDFTLGIYDKAEEDSVLTTDGKTVKILKMLNNRFGPADYQAEFTVNFNNMSIEFNE